MGCVSDWGDGVWATAFGSCTVRMGRMERGVGMGMAVPVGDPALFRRVIVAAGLLKRESERRTTIT